MASATDTQIIRATIHPAIGVARVGNSETAFFVGPLVADPEPCPVGFYRDDAGALKRQAAQFRIYGYNQAGDVVRELTADSADITWSVHVANRKAAWYQWQLALDIPEAATVAPPLRNASVENRASLVIDAGRQSISGKNTPPVRCAGAFTGVPVKLGELRTDEQGRLLFLGGHGVSASPANTPVFLASSPNSFINADGWYDDTCDGPVNATVSIDGRSIPVDEAWVVTAPPNYAPQLKSLRSMYDLMVDMYYQATWLAPPATVSFTKDVYPILRRLSGLQWVNQGFAAQFGHNGRNDFANPYLASQLGSPSRGGYDPHEELRLQIRNHFRLPSLPDGSPTPWPWVYGDAMGEPPGHGPRHNSAITQTQYDVLEKWAAGEFVSDWDDPAVRPPTSIEQVPLDEQPAMLDRAALEFCIADVFHPGSELTFPMRHLTIYSKPFRIRARPADAQAPDYGPTLNQTTVLAANGPLHAQGPGGLTRWMGLPWQADTAYCRAGYTPSYDPFLPAFWPARVPNQVLSAVDYAKVIDPARPMAERAEAFNNRTNWNHPLYGDTEVVPGTATQMATMVRIFGSMGLVETRPGATDTTAFPATVMVASYGPGIAPADEMSVPPTPPAPVAAAATSAAPSPKVRKLPRGANFRSHEEAKNAPRPVKRG